MNEYEYEDIWEAVADELPGVLASDLRGKLMGDLVYVDSEPHTITTLQIRDAIDAALEYQQNDTP